MLYPGDFLPLLAPPLLLIAFQTTMKDQADAMITMKLVKL